MAGNGSRAGSGRAAGGNVGGGTGTNVGRRVMGSGMPATRSRLNVRMAGTVKKNPWKGIPAGDRQGMREAIAIRYGRRDPAVDAVRRRRR